MQSNGWPTLAFLIAIMALALPSTVAYETSIGGGESVSTTSGASSGILVADAAGATAVGGGAGDFSGNWWVKNSAGMYAEVGMEILNSESYSYDYTLNPGEGGGWSASAYPEVSASESLDIKNANYIKAYAIAKSAKKFDAITSTEIADSGKRASLLGYTNEAKANKNGVSVTQRTENIISWPSYEIFKCESNAIRRTPNEATATATFAGYAEAIGFDQIASADTIRPLAENDVDFMGVGKVSVSAKDSKGKEASSQTSYVGVYSEEQYADLDASSAYVKRASRGVGYFDGLTTLVKCGTGTAASATQSGAFSGNMITNRQEVEASTSKANAIQVVEFEYDGPFAYHTGTYDRFIGIDFSTSAKYGDNKAASDIDVSYGEHLGGSQTASASGSGASSTLDSDLIGKGISKTLAAGNGKEASSQASYDGVYHEEQSASIGASTALATLTLIGVGYFEGATTSAKYGIQSKFGRGTGTTATMASATESGAFSGNMITNEQSALASTIGANAIQDAEFQYMPFASVYRPYDVEIGVDFFSSARYNAKENHKTEENDGKDQLLTHQEVYAGP